MFCFAFDKYQVPTGFLERRPNIMKNYEKNEGRVRGEL